MTDTISATGAIAAFIAVVSHPNQPWITAALKATTTAEGPRWTAAHPKVVLKGFYGSAEHHEKFAESLANTGANENQIRGRLAAARSEGTHPSAAVTMGKGAAKARKTRSGAAMGAERGKGGPSR